MPRRKLLKSVWLARPGRVPAAGALLSGLLVAAGQAPLGLWWLALAGLTALTAIIAATQPMGRRAWLGWIAGLGYFSATMFWIVEPFLVEPEVYAWMAPFALISMAGGLALFWMVAALLAGAGSTPGTRAVGFAAGIAAADLLRSYAFGGFPWGLVGHIWIGTPLAQAASVIGPIGLTILTAGAVALPVAVRGRIARPVAGAVAVLALGGVWIAGQARLDKPDPVREPAIRVRLIQPNATQSLKWKDEWWRVFLDRQMQMTGRPAEKPLNLVVWPETAVPFLLDRVGSLFEEMAALSRGVPMAVGIQRRDGARFFNSLAVSDGSGRVTQVYDKYRLAPFGEYIPGGDWLTGLGVSAFASRAGNGYSAGPGARILDLGAAGLVMPLICYEADFPQVLRAAEGRADWILQVTNDGWFGNLAGPYQHLAQMRLRAIEMGLPLLRSANTGISAVIDAKGRILQSLPLNTEGLIDAEVPGALPPTPYVRWGDLPATVAIAAVLLLLLLRRRTVND